MDGNQKLLQLQTTKRGDYSTIKQTNYDDDDQASCNKPVAQIPVVYASSKTVSNPNGDITSTKTTITTANLTTKTPIGAATALNSLPSTMHSNKKLNTSASATLSTPTNPQQTVTSISPVKAADIEININTTRSSIQQSDKNGAKSKYSVGGSNKAKLHTDINNNNSKNNNNNNNDEEYEDEEDDIEDIDQDASSPFKALNTTSASNGNKNSGNTAHINATSNTNNNNNLKSDLINLSNENENKSSESPFYFSLRF